LIFRKQLPPFGGLVQLVYCVSIFAKYMRKEVDSSMFITVFVHLFLLNGKMSSD